MNGSQPKSKMPQSILIYCPVVSKKDASKKGRIIFFLWVVSPRTGYFNKCCCFRNLILKKGSYLPMFCVHCRLAFSLHHQRPRMKEAAQKMCFQTWPGRRYCHILVGSESSAHKGHTHFCLSASVPSKLPGHTHLQEQKKRAPKSKIKKTFDKQC